MAIDQTLVGILDETIEALSKLDLEKLNSLERQIVLLAESNAKFEKDSIGLTRPKIRQLEIMLQNCQVNLDALTRLHARNMRKQWAQ
jgi:hypothetical protein